MSELCRRFGVSRKTGYKWLHRYLGNSELEDRSRRPKVSPKAVSEAIEAGIVAARKMRRTWGPRKLCASLQRSNPGIELPSVTTFALTTETAGENFRVASASPLRHFRRHRPPRLAISLPAVGEAASRLVSVSASGKGAALPARRRHTGTAAPPATTPASHRTVPLPASPGLQTAGALSRAPPVAFEI